MDDALAIDILERVPAAERPHSRTVADSWRWAALVALLVGGSSIIRFWAALDLREPWIAPDEMLYGLIGRSFWQTHHMGLLGTSSPFVGFYPLLAGLPLAIFGTATGLVILQAAQAFLMSLTGMLVFVWARRYVSGPWAAGAAVMTLAGPDLARSGEVMTEAVYLPLATLALWLFARALVAPTRGNQIRVGVAVTASLAVRFQGVAFLLVMVLAAAFMALFDRNPRLLRRLWPMFVSVLIGVVVLYGARLAIGAQANVLGAYTDSVSGGYRIVSVFGWAMREVGDLFLLVLGLPLVAAASLLVARISGHESSREIGALLSVTFAYIAVTVFEVGAFASQHVHRLAERDLITTAPPICDLCGVARTGRIAWAGALGFGGCLRRRDSGCIPATGLSRNARCCSGRLVGRSASRLRPTDVDPCARGGLDYRLCVGRADRRSSAASGGAAACGGGDRGPRKRISHGG